jgi:hypothetical protein
VALFAWRVISSTGGPSCSAALLARVHLPVDSLRRRHSQGRGCKEHTNSDSTAWRGGCCQRPRPMTLLPSQTHTPRDTPAGTARVDNACPSLAAPPGLTSRSCVMRSGSCRLGSSWRRARNSLWVWCAALRVERTRRCRQRVHKQCHTPAHAPTPTTTHTHTHTHTHTPELRDCGGCLLPLLHGGRRQLRSKGVHARNQLVDAGELARGPAQAQGAAGLLE